MSEQALTTTNQAVGLPASEDLTGLGTLELKPTKLNLLQPTTRDKKGGQAGQYLDVLTGELFDEITVVPLRFSKTRSMFPPGNDLDVQPICRSNDGIVPAIDVDTPQAAQCAQCPNSRWSIVNGKKQKPACPEKYRFLVVLKDNGMPKWLNVGGASIAPFLETMNRIKYVIFNNGLKGEGPPLELFDFYFTMSSNNEGTYFTMKFKDVKKVLEPGTFGPLFEQYVVSAKAYQEAQAENYTSVQLETSADAAVSEIIEAEEV